MSGGFVFEPLGRHDRSRFASDLPMLDRYLKESASQNVRRLVAGSFVVLETATPSVAGFYTRCAYMKAPLHFINGIGFGGSRAGRRRFFLPLETLKRADL